MPLGAQLLPLLGFSLAEQRLLALSLLAPTLQLCLLPLTKRKQRIFSLRALRLAPEAPRLLLLALSLLLLAERYLCLLCRSVLRRCLRNRRPRDR